MRIYGKILAAGLVAFAALPALTVQTVHADESLESVEYWKGQMAYMKDKIDSANQKCGTTFAFEWSNKEDLRKKAGDHNNSPNGICSNVFDSLWSVCDKGDEAKNRVKTKIKGVSCGYGKPRSMTLSGTKLVAGANNEESNWGDWATPTLMKML